MYPHLRELLDLNGAGRKLLEQLLAAAQKLAKQGAKDLDLEALEGSIRVLSEDAAPELRELVRHLREHLMFQRSPPRLFDRAAEVGVAAWLCARGVLAPPPGFSAGVDGVLDLGAILPTGVVGVEVKRDQAALSDQLLLGSGPRDAAPVLPALRARFGADIAVGVRWQPFEPSPEEWCQHRVRVTKAILKRVCETKVAPSPERNLVIRVDLKPLNTSMTTVSITVSRSFVVSVESRFGGDGWGPVAGRIRKHGADKSAKTVHPFVLVYHSVAGGRRVVTPDRLPWAWVEIEADLDPKVQGVVALQQDLESPPHWTARGVFRREHVHLAEVFGVGLLRAGPETETAGAAWTRLVDQVRLVGAEVNDSDDAHRWAELAVALDASGCGEVGADRLVQEVVVLASRLGRNLDIATRYHVLDLPFPCGPETMLVPRVTQPRR